MMAKAKRNPELNRLYFAVGLAVLIWVIFRCYRLLSASVESGILSRANTTYVGVEHVILAGRASGRNFKDVAGSVGGVYFAITCSGPHDGWTWSEVVDIAERQRLKILSGGAT